MSSIWQALVIVMTMISASDALAAPITSYATAGANVLNPYGRRQNFETSLNGGTAHSSVGSLSTTGTESEAEGSLSTALIRSRALAKDAFGPYYGPAIYISPRIASSSVEIGDSFTTTGANGSPFVWDNSTATFSFTIDGTSAVQSSVASDSASAVLDLVILRPGTLSSHLRTYDTFISLDPSESFVSDLLFTFGFGLTPQSTMYNDYFDPTFEGSRPVDQVVDPKLGATVNASFNPNGDFDWIISMYSGAVLHAGALSGEFVSSDFYNTIHASYIAPEGATTRSASGVFPGTSAGPQLISEPESVLLFAIASVSLLVTRLRRRTLSSQNFQPPIFLIWRITCF